MINEPISEEIIQQAVAKGACSEGIESARQSTWETLPRKYQECAIINLQLPDEVADYLFSLGYGRRYWKNGRLHREDGPAIEYSSGTKSWWKNGQLHREDGPAIEYSSGRKEWWLNGQLHREDGPAIEYSSGRKEWWLNGKHHREDGPAVEYPNGCKEWWLNNVSYAEEEFLTKVNK